MNVGTVVDYSDIFAVRWWQWPMRKRIVQQRFRRYLPEPDASEKPPESHT